MTYYKYALGPRCDYLFTRMGCGKANRGASLFVSFSFELELPKVTRVGNGFSLVRFGGRV